MIREKEKRDQRSEEIREEKRVGRGEQRGERREGATRGGEQRRGKASH